MRVFSGCPTTTLQEEAMPHMNHTGEALLLWTEIGGTGKQTACLLVLADNSPECLVAVDAGIDYIAKEMMKYAQESQVAGCDGN